jgi:hypothetical protein
MVKRTWLLVLAMLGAVPAADAAEFRSAQLGANGVALTFLRSDGSTFSAPKDEGQDGFASPGISRNHRYAAWVALYRDHGATYSQPLELAVADSSGRIHRFSGRFGMIFGWCFAEKSGAVVYRFAFPHGATPVAFEMRRISDRKLLRSFQLPAEGPSQDEDPPIRPSAPAWTTCTQHTSAVE